MNNKDLQLLIEIYNTLLSCHYSDNDIFKSAEALKAFQQFIYAKNDELQQSKKEE